MEFHKTYDSGLKLIIKKMDGLFSVSTGILVGVGSRNESKEENGISHFIEHMNFKGTKNYSAFTLSEAFDEIGSQVNAFTSKEITCYYVKSTNHSLKTSFKLLCDLFLNSTYLPEEIEKEKGVVLEEINMCEDTPEDVCLDNLALAHFGDEGLGRCVLGPSKNIKSFCRENIIDYLKDYYNSDNIVISFAGNITPSQAESLVEEYFLPFVSTEKSKNQTVVNKTNLGKVIKKNKDIEQNHLAISFDGIAYDAEFFNESSLFNTVLGGGMSSRLFQRIREELGLCYTVYSYPSAYRTVGSLAIYAGLNPNQTNEAYDAIFKLLKELKNTGISQKEYEKGKAQVLSSYAFGQESTASQMMLFGKYLLFTGKLFDFENEVYRIENITHKKVNELVDKINFDKFSLALVGKTAEKTKF